MAQCVKMDDSQGLQSLGSSSAATLCAEYARQAEETPWPVHPAHLDTLPPTKSKRLNAVEMRSCASSYFPVITRSQTMLCVGTSALCKRERLT